MHGNVTLEVFVLIIIFRQNTLRKLGLRGKDKCLPLAIVCQNAKRKEQVRKQTAYTQVIFL